MQKKDHTNPPNPPPTGGEENAFEGGRAKKEKEKEKEWGEDQEKKLQKLFQKFVQHPLFKDPRMTPKVFWRKQRSAGKRTASRRT